MLHSIVEKQNLKDLPWERWKDEILSLVTSHLQKNLSKYYPELSWASQTCIVIAKPPKRRRFTMVAEVAVINSNGEIFKKLIIKAYRITARKGTRKDARDQDIEQKSLSEFEFHQQAYQYFHGEKDTYSVVKPVDYLPELLCLITEKAEGIDLGKLIRRAHFAVSGYSLQRQELGLHFQRCGKWLALLHKSFTSDRPANFDSKKIGQQVNHYFNRFKKAGGSVNIADPIRQKILLMTDLFKGTTMPQGRLHGDFKLRHIFVTDKTITPIDFGNEFEGDMIHDVARLLVEVKLINFGRVLPLRSELTDYLQKQFLRGYLGNGQYPALLRYYYIIWLWAKWDRRLVKLATNPIAKKIDPFLGPLGIKAAINKTYVNKWFYHELTSELNQLQMDLFNYYSN